MDSLTWPVVGSSWPKSVTAMLNVPPIAAGVGVGVAVGLGAAVGVGWLTMRTTRAWLATSQIRSARTTTAAPTMPAIVATGSLRLGTTSQSTPSGVRINNTGVPHSPESDRARLMAFRASDVAASMGKLAASAP